MALRRNADLSRMEVEAEMREIGIAPEKSFLHPKQIEVLKKAQDPKVNVMVLYGGTGSGKTNLAAEVVKIWMAQHFANNLDVSNNYCLVLLQVPKNFMLV
jgi:chromosomal replication initiation ATPase DnaA